MGHGRSYPIHEENYSFDQASNLDLYARIALGRDRFSHKMYLLKVAAVVGSCHDSIAPCRLIYAVRLASPRA